MYSAPSIPIAGYSRLQESGCRINKNSYRNENAAGRGVSEVGPEIVSTGGASAYHLKGVYSL